MKSSRIVKRMDIRKVLDDTEQYVCFIYHPLQYNMCDWRVCVYLEFLEAKTFFSGVEHHLRGGNYEQVIFEV